MKRLALFSVCGIVLLSLTGCLTPQIIVKEKPVVVEIPSELYNCPKHVKYPNYETLTDEETATTIIVLAATHERCYNSQEAIKKHQEMVKNKINQ